MLLEVFKLAHLYGLPKLYAVLLHYIKKLDLDQRKEYCFGTNGFTELLNFAFTYKIVDLYERMKILIKFSKKKKGQQIPRTFRTYQYKVPYFGRHIRSR